MRKLSWMLLCLCCWGTAQAASFDCEQARTPVEKLICADPQLEDLDVELSEAYGAAQKELPPAEAGRLRQEQLLWLRNTRNRCADAACLIQAHKTRVNALDPYADKNLTCQEMRLRPRRVFTGAIDLGSGHGSPIEVDYSCPDSLSSRAFMQKLLGLAERIRSQDAPQVCTGSIIHAQWRYYHFRLAQAGIAPRTLQAWALKADTADWTTFLQQDPSGTATYFRQWSEQSHHNQAMYAEFVGEFNKAAAQLVSLYSTQYNLSADEASAASLQALNDVVQRTAGSSPKAEMREEFTLLALLRGGVSTAARVREASAGLGVAYIEPALRVALIHNQPVEVIAALLDRLGGVEVLKPEDRQASGLQAPEVREEPLLSLAIGRDANLAYLLQKKVPVDTANDFGKTALFYAIGAGRHSAVDLLLRHKANVNHTYKSAKELRPSDDECIYPGLRHTRRSPLMHAAQNSDVRMLQILLQTGARLDARDDLGYNAHDYALMGKNTDNARYLASLGLEPAAPRYSRDPDPGVREQTPLTMLKFDGYVKKLALAPGRPDLLVASVSPWSSVDGGPTTGLYLISLANPEQPRIMGHYLNVNPSDFALSPDGQRIYFFELWHQKAPAGKTYGLKVLDISRPDQPVLRTQVDGDFMVMHLSPDGRTLYLQERHLKPESSRGLLVYAIAAGAPSLRCSNPFGQNSINQTLFAYGFVSFPEEALLAIRDNIQYLFLFDVRNPCAPKKLMETRYEGAAQSISGGVGRTLVTPGLNMYRLGDGLELMASYTASDSGGFHVNPETGLTVALMDKDLAVLRTKPSGTYVMTDRVRGLPAYPGSVLSTATGHIYIGGKDGLAIGKVPLR
jgi:uncharacterized protein YecT (DUF1311 family)